MNVGSMSLQRFSDVIPQFSIVPKAIRHRVRQKIPENIEFFMRIFHKMKLTVSMAQCNNPKTPEFALSDCCLEHISANICSAAPRHSLENILDLTSLGKNSKSFILIVRQKNEKVSVQFIKRVMEGKGSRGINITVVFK